MYMYNYVQILKPRWNKHGLQCTTLHSWRDCLYNGKIVAHWHIEPQGLWGKGLYCSLSWHCCSSHFSSSAVHHWIPPATQASDVTPPIKFVPPVNWILRTLKSCTGHRVHTQFCMQNSRLSYFFHTIIFFFQTQNATKMYWEHTVTTM